MDPIVKGPNLYNLYIRHTLIPVDFIRFAYWQKLYLFESTESTINIFN